MDTSIPTDVVTTAAVRGGFASGTRRPGRGLA